MLEIEVIYATLEVQQPISLQMPDGATVSQALVMANIEQRYPELKGKDLTVGIFGEVIHDPDTYQLDDGDRVEIYRPLLIDPKEARRQRAKM